MIEIKLENLMMSVSISIRIMIMCERLWSSSDILIMMMNVSVFSFNSHCLRNLSDTKNSYWLLLLLKKILMVWVVLSYDFLKYDLWILSLRHQKLSYIFLNITNWIILRGKQSLFCDKVISLGNLWYLSVSRERLRYILVT